jgi:hypothetical protein
MFEKGATIARLRDPQNLVVSRRGDAVAVGADELRVPIGDEGFEPQDPDRCEGLQVLSQRVSMAQSGVQIVDLSHGKHGNDANE